MKGRLGLRVGARTDEGLQRTHNEDNYFVDAERGFFAVIDGVGGQNAGEVAAETARRELLARLERADGTIEQALREGITIANNKIFQSSRGHPELKGMACVLSAAVVAEGQVHIGHVGDSRIYKVRRGQIVKLTHDHSPVGEREDRGELSEVEAMRHVRRNEVYRDIGSEPHQGDDPDFIEYLNAPFEADAALVLCSDGLSDLVFAAQILERVMSSRGNPQQSAERLVQAALEEGGKDNVTVLVVEGPEFAPALPVTRSGSVIPPYLQPVEGDEPTSRLADRGSSDPSERPTLKLIRNPAAQRSREGAGHAAFGGVSPLSGAAQVRATPIDPLRSDGARSQGSAGEARAGNDSAARVIPLTKGDAARTKEAQKRREEAASARPFWSRIPGWVFPLLTMTLVTIGLVSYLLVKQPPPSRPAPPVQAPVQAPEWKERSVPPGMDLNDAIANATDHTILIVPPGEYETCVKLKSKIQLVAETPWTVTIDPAPNPAAASSCPAIEATDVQEAGVYGIVVGKPDAPRPVGIRLVNSDVTLVDMGINGTTEAGIQVLGGGHPLIWRAVVTPISGKKIDIQPMSEATVRGEQLPAPMPPQAPVPTGAKGSTGAGAAQSAAEKPGPAKPLDKTAVKLKRSGGQAGRASGAVDANGSTPQRSNQSREGTP